MANTSLYIVTISSKKARVGGSLTCINCTHTYPPPSPYWTLTAWRKKLYFPYFCISNAWLIVQFSSVAQLCQTFCDAMDWSMPGFPVYHQLPELAQTHVHQVSDAIQPRYPLSFPSPPAFSLSQHQGLFQWVSSSHQMAKVLELQLRHQSFQWIFRTDFL